MFRVIHPDCIRNPTWIRSSNVKVGVRISINIDLVFPLETKLVVVYPDVAELADDDVDEG